MGSRVDSDRLVELAKEATESWKKCDYLPEFDLNNAFLGIPSTDMLIVPTLDDDGEIIPMVVLPPGTDADAACRIWDEATKKLHE